MNGPINSIHTPVPATGPTSVITAADANLNQLSSESSFEGSYVCEFNSKSQKWECQQFYKTQILQSIIDQHDNKDGRQTIDQLKEFGITVYLAEHDTVNMKLLRQVISHVSANKNDNSRERHENQRCILYRNKDGQLFNLTLNNGSGGLAGAWKNLIISFSGLQAMVAMCVLARAFACMNPNSNVQPGYFLGLLLGLVLYEEMSHSFLNVAMLVQGLPSVAAFSLVSGFDSDWARKIAVFMLALAAAQEGGSFAQKVCTLLGIATSMCLLAVNLGSRAWQHMRWKPIRQIGLLTPVYAFIAALVTGLLFPFMGFRRIQSGGKSAIRLIIINCAIVAILFVLSDMDAVQGFLYQGEACDQSITNIALGSWLAFSSISCIFAARSVTPPETVEDAEGEIDLILDEDQTSPVGFRVPNFPDFPIDPAHYTEDGFTCVSTNVQTFIAVLTCLGLGCFVGLASIFDYFAFENQ